MLRGLVALFLAAHGLAHLVGFLGAFQLGEFAGTPVATSLLWGRLEVSEPVARLLGVAWLALAAGFGLAAVAWWRRLRQARAILLGVTALSMVMTILAAPAAIIGLGANIAILGGVLVAALRTPARPGPRSSLFSGPMAGTH